MVCVCIRVLGVKVKGRAVMRRTVCGGEGEIRGQKLHSGMCIATIMLLL